MELFKVIEDIRCKKDPLCDKTADFIEEYSKVEFQKRKIERTLEEANTTLILKDREIESLRKIFYDKFNTEFKEAIQEIAKEQEIKRLRQQVNELLEFKKSYEPILKDIEREFQIAKEIQSEIEGLETKKEQVADIQSFIKKHFQISEEDYEQIADW
ncbi:MAG: hypothetical protein HZB61_12730 [Nitrospirae bacterium]|nr:hypothetical protein [Nitrospirota bacterium]